MGSTSVGQAKRRVVIVCDPGMDDALALLWLLNQPDVVVEAIVAVAGNVSPADSARNSAWLLSAAGRRDIPIYSTESIDQFYECLPAIMGDDGIGGFASGFGEYRPADLSELAVSDVELLALGPATVPALLIDRFDFVSVTWMGGVLYEVGNAPDGGECNSSADLDGAHKLMALGSALQIVPLDATRKVCFHVDDPLADSALWDQSELFTSVARRYCELAQVRGRQQAYPHDLVAAAAFLKPEKFTWQSGSCELDGARLQLGTNGPRIATGTTVG